MAELLEYCLIFLLSSSMGGASVIAFDSFNGHSQAVSGGTVLSVLSSGAYSALVHGNSTVSLAAYDSTITCHGGKLAESSPGFNGSVSIPADCDFGFAHVTGVHVLRFWYGSGVLKLEVV